MATRIAAHDILRRWIDKSSTTQSKIARKLGVSRAAVSKWCAGAISPSVEHADALELISEGAIPATAWPRRRMPEPVTPGAARLQMLARERGMTILQLATERDIPARALARWASGAHAPRKAGVEMLNEKLGLRLSREDFRAGA